jgi:hypothetical protein
MCLMILGRNQEALVEHTTIHKYGETSELRRLLRPVRVWNTISDHLSGIFHQMLGTVKKRTGLSAHPANSFALRPLIHVVHARAVINFNSRRPDLFYIILDVSLRLAGDLLRPLVVVTAKLEESEYPSRSVQVLHITSCSGTSDARLTTPTTVVEGCHGHIRWWMVWVVLSRCGGC